MSEIERGGKARILCVDDEPHVLDALVRNLRLGFDVQTATSGAAGLERLGKEGPFAVVVSDMRMPGMSGSEFLARARAAAPDTVRILLTGHADVNAAISAVNDGNIYRFLTKPCPADRLRETLETAAQQYRLVTAERVLLEQTLHGCIKALVDVLALSSPAAFGRAMRAKRIVADLAREMAVGETWQLEIAAMLSQLGGVSLPAATAEKLYLGLELGPDERAMVDRMPAIAEQLLANIPRIDPVREILAHQAARFDGSGSAPAALRGEALPMGARLLKLALDLDVLETQGTAKPLALETLRGRSGWYDPAALEALASLGGGDEGRSVVKELSLDAIRPGMILVDDLTTRTGLLLMARGQEVTVGMLAKIRNFSPSMGVKEPIRIRPNESRIERAAQPAPA